MKIISDLRICSITSKGPKYRLPSQIDLNKCREEIAVALNEFCKRWCRRRKEHVECNALNSWKISFYSKNPDLLPPKPISKLPFRHLKQGIQQFNEKCVWAPADKASNNAIVVLRLYYINFLKSELSTAKTYELISTDEKSVANKHCNDIVTKLAVGITEDRERLPTFYRLPKLYKRPYKARFIANSSSCTATSLSKVLTSCLTDIKNHWIKYCEKKTYEGEGINYSWSIKKSTEILNKLKAKGFQASSISTYDFSTLYIYTTQKKFCIT